MVQLEPRACKSGHIYDDPPCCSYPHGKVSAVAAFFALVGVLFSVPALRRCSFVVREIEITAAGEKTFSREFDFGVWYVKGRWNADFEDNNSVSVTIEEDDNCYGYPDGFELDTPFQLAQAMSIISLVLGGFSFLFLSSYACNIWPANKRVMAAAILFTAVACTGLTFMVLQTESCTSDSPPLLPSGFSVNNYSSSCSVGTDGILTGIGMAMYFIAGVVALTIPEGQMPESGDDEQPPAKPAVDEAEP